MGGGPLHHQPEGSWRQFSAKHGQRFYSDLRLVAAVTGMEMRRLMVAVEIPMTIPKNRLISGTGVLDERLSVAEADLAGEELREEQVANFGQ